MAPLLKWDHRFDIGALVAIVVAAISIYGIWQSQRDTSPRVNIEQRDGVQVLGLGSEDTLYLAIPLRISNSGGRAVELARFERTNREPMLFRNYPGAMLEDDPDLVGRFAVVDGLHNSSREIAQLFPVTVLDDLALPHYTQIPIQSGGQRYITILLEIRDRSGRDLRQEFVTISMTLRFSDETTHRVAFAHTGQPNSHRQPTASD